MISQIAKYLPWISRKTVTLPALQTAFDAGTTPQKAAFQSSVLGDRVETLLGLLFRRPLKVGGFGNSIMNLEGSFWQRICSLSGGMLYYDRTTNYAVSGENSAQTLARVLAAPKGQIGDVVFLMEGANDAAGSVSVATHFANIVACIRGIKERSGLPVLVSPPPRTDNGAITNNWIKKYRVADFLAAAQEGIPIIDPWRSVILSADGDWVPGSVNGDNIHPTSDTHYIAAGAAYAQLKQGGSPVVLSPLCATGEPGLLSNPLFAGTVGSLSGVAVYGTGYTATVGTAARGQYLRLTGAGSGVQGTIQMDATSGFSVGDRIALTAIMRASGIALPDVFLTCQVTPAYSGVATLIRYDKCADGAYQIYAEFVVPAGATGLQFLAQLGQGGAETGYIQIEQTQMYNLTTILA
jgi:lysophospholipase L1-like esterase